MRRMSRLARTLGAFGAIALIATACGGDDEETGDATGTGETGGGEAAADGGESGGEFSVYVCEPQHLVPTNTNESCGSEVLHALYSPLVTYDDETNPQWGDEAPNAMAQEITSEDNQNWTVTIKDGWTFHNGEPVTAQSFVDAWNYGAYGPNAQGNSYFFDKIEGYDDLQPEEEGGEPAAETLTGLTAVDDTTIEVNLGQPFSQFPLTLGYTAFFPVPTALLDDPAAFEESPIGNGPYMMEEPWAHDQYIRTVKFEDYAGEPGNADAIEFRIYADINTGYTDLQAGQLDVMDELPPDVLATVEQDFGDRYGESEDSGYTYLGLPHYNEFFADDQVGQALSMAVDRQAIIDAIFNGARTPATSVVSPVVQGWGDVDSCGANCDFNPEEAKRLWDEVSDGLELPMRVWFNSGAGHEDWVQAVTNQWSQNLGIPSDQIQFESLQFADYLDALEGQEMDGPYRLGWGMDYPSAQNYLEPMHATEGSSNYDDYSNEEVDQLIAQGNQAPTLEESIEFYQQAEQLVVDDFHHVPMWFDLNQFAWADTVSGVEVDAFAHLNVAEIVVEQ